MATARLTTQGRITIPAQVRTSLGLAAGDHVEFVTLRDGSVEFLGKTGSVHTLKGLICRRQRS
jgi:AbrB family looped-hinge helix DNA binding protein